MQRLTMGSCLRPVLRSYGAGLPAGHTGIVLISTLIFLIVVTMLSLFSVRQISLQERAVGSLMDRQNALQASDLAVREGTRTAQDNSLNSEILQFAADCNKNGNADLQGLCLPQADTYWKTYAWAAVTTANEDKRSRATTLTSEKYVELPRYYIEYLGANKLMPGQELNVKSGFKLFKIVGRGVGTTSDSFVLTEKTIAIPPPPS